MAPVVLLVAAIAVPLIWLQRKMQSKNFSPARLQVSGDEIHLLEQASNEQLPVFINDKECILQPISAEKQHVHSNCGCCPDELHLNDIQGRACLSASRELGSETWHVTAMEPVVWGLLGHTSSDLMSLRVGNQPIGHVSNAPEITE